MPVRIVIALAAALLGICLGLLIFTMGDTTEPRQPQVTLAAASPPGPAVDPNKPFFVATEGRPVPPQDSFLNAQGGQTRIGDFKGKIVVLNFWATWCAPCVKELPSLARLKAAHPDGDLAVVAVNLDKPDTAGTAAFLKEIEADGLEPFTDPTKAMMRSYRVNGLPTTILIGADGHEIGRHEGDVAWDSPQAAAAIAAALQAP